MQCECVTHAFFRCAPHTRAPILSNSCFILLLSHDTVKVNFLNVMKFFLNLTLIVHNNRFFKKIFDKCSWALKYIYIGSKKYICNNKSFINLYYYDILTSHDVLFYFVHISFESLMRPK